MITVGVAAYNAAGTLPQLLSSLLAQEYPRHLLEVVVADNGSSDETCAVVKRFSEMGPIRLVRAVHRRGPAVGRNAVIAAGRGEIVAFTDADCVAHPRWLAEIEDAFREPTVGCVAGGILAGESRTATERFYARRKILSQELVLAHPFLPYAQTANAAFRREVFKLVGIFDEDLITCEDADILWRMQLETGYALSYRPQAMVWHQHRSSPRALLRQAIGWGIGHALVYRKYQDRMHREAPDRVVGDYLRIARLAGLCLRRWIGREVRNGTGDALEDAYLLCLMCLGIKVGRWKGSLQGRVFYP